MSDQYEEWFHRETQEILSVKVGDADAGFPNEIVFTLCSHCNQWYEVFREDLQRDYIRDEPLTVELVVARLGWKTGPTSRGCFADKQFGDRRFTLWWRADEKDEPDDFTVSWDGGEPQSLLFPTTLRDLLHTLRVAFGLKDSVTPATTETEPTAKA